jgi:cyclic-di-GMP-binding protein
MALDWLTKGLGKKPKSNHPLATSDSLQDVIDSLPVSNPTRLIGEIGEWIAPAEKTDLSLQTRVNAYTRLDEEAQPFVNEIWFGMLATPVADPRAEQAWFALQAYARSVMRCYHDLMRDYSAAGETGLDKKTAIVLLARAIHAAVTHKKLLRMRYRFVEPTIWAETYWLYAYGEVKGLSRTMLHLYSKRGVETTAHREFVVGMIFEIAPLGNIDPHQMESLDQIIRKLDPFFSFREKRDSDTLFYVDLAKNQWPDRLLEGLAHKPTMRYFGVGVALGHVIRILKEVLRAREIPEWLVLPGEDKIDNCVVLLRKLIVHWSKEPPKRQHSRERQEAAINVLHGFGQIRRMIAGVNYLKSGKTIGYVSYQELFDMHRYGFVNEKRAPPKSEAVKDTKELLKKVELAGDKELMQKWTVNDSSESGIGATAVQHSDWLRIGALVGFRYEDKMDWSVSVVRRLSRNQQNQAMVGLQLFKGDPDCARAGSLDKREQSAWDVIPEAGIYGWQDAMVLQGTSTMLLGPGSYFDGRRFKITISTVKIFVKLTELIETGPDFELVRYSEYNPDETTLPPTQTRAASGFPDAPGS